jgi:WD40 repeat protein
MRSKFPAGIKRLRAFDRSGTLAAALNTDNRLCMLNTDSGEVLWTDPQVAQGLLLAAFSSDQADVFCSIDRSGTATLRRTRRGDVIRTFPVADCSGVAVSADGTRAACIATDGSGTVIDLQGGRDVLLPALMSEAWAVSISKDGQIVALGGTGKVCLYRTDASRPPIVISIGDATATAVALSPDATRLACSGHAGVRIYETDRGMLVGSLTDSELGINAAVWSNDGRYLAAAGGSSNSDSQVIVWDSQLPPAQHPDANALTKSR